MLAAKHPDFHNDVYLKPALSAHPCGFQVINVVDDFQPSQDEYLDILRKAGVQGYRFRIRMPWKIAKLLVNGISYLNILFPAVYRRFPRLFKKATFHARMKGLRYSNARLKDRLGWIPEQDSQHSIINSLNFRKDSTGQL